jgi:hypothetical protein
MATARTQSMLTLKLVTTAGCLLMATQLISGCNKKKIEEGTGSTQPQNAQNQPQTSTQQQSTLTDSKPSTPSQTEANPTEAKQKPTIQPNPPGATTPLTSPQTGVGIAATTPSAPLTPPTLTSAPGLNSVTTQKAPEAEKVSPPKEPDPTCFTELFAHNKTKGHESDDACGTHLNLLTLKQPLSELNSKSICVKADGKPVRFKIKNDKILVGAIAGPQTQFSVRYCIGKVTCDALKDCEIAKDELLGVLGADTDSLEGESPTITNDEVHQKLAPEVKRALAQLDQQDSFQGWKSDRTPELACQTQRITKSTQKK